MIFIYPRHNLKIKAKTKEEASKKFLDIINKKLKDNKATNGFADLNKDGKVDEKDFTIASKTLNQAKKNK